MHPHEIVVVIENEPAILRRWQQGAREFGVSFVPDTPCTENALAAIQSAVGPVRGLADPEKRISVVETAEGYAFLLYPAGDRVGILTILREVAHALGDAGFSGKLQGAQDLLAKHDSDVVPSFNAVLCSTRAVIRMGEPPDFVSSPPPGGSYWKAGSPEFASLVRQCLDWARETSDGRYLLSSGMLSVFCREDQVAKFITEACANVGAAVLEVLSAKGELLRAAFGLDGYILLSSPSANVPWQRGLDLITRRVTQAAALIDYGLIRRSYYEASSIEQIIDFGHPRPEYLGSGFHTNHFALKMLVPDVFGTQILGPGHPEFVPASEWIAEALPDGRRLISSRQIERWYGADFAEEDVLDRARLENHGALFTYDSWRARSIRAVARNRP